MNNEFKNRNHKTELTSEFTKNVYITNTLQISRKNIIIDKHMINRYIFLSSFLHEEAIFFEDIYFSIFYILTIEEDDNNDNQNKKSKCIIHNFMIDKLKKSYCKNSLPYYDFKDGLLNINFRLFKKSFIYSNLHLSGYEYDLNHDINEWLNMVKYEDVIYILPYISQIKNFDYDYTF